MPDVTELEIAIRAGRRAAPAGGATTPPGSGRSLLAPAVDAGRRAPRVASAYLLADVAAAPRREPGGHGAWCASPPTSPPAVVARRCSG